MNARMSHQEKVNSFTDVAERAQSTLDYIINETDEKVATRQSSRNRSRVLFVTSDRSALDETSSVQQQLKEVRAMFAEVHLVVLGYGKTREYPSTRVAENMWVYNVNFSSTWFLSHVIKGFAESQLQFKGGFRPDIIVSLDPFYAGKAAEALAYEYDRPLQVHVTTDFLTPTFLEENKDNKKKVRMARSVLKRETSFKRPHQLQFA
jgi:hypothetical protein